LLYTRQLKVEPETPALSYLGGNSQGAHFVARSSWEDSATIVALRSTDHFGDHNHYDQGSFVVYRSGLLAVDPPVYQKVRGPQQRTENHNTLLLGGQPQRPVRGQWYVTLADFEKNLNAGARLETGDMPFYREAGDWAAASAQFSQAYDPGIVARCVRQLLFVRPNRVVVVDRIAAPDGKSAPEVDWLLQFPRKPEVAAGTAWATNGTSWLRCQAVLPGGSEPQVGETPVRTFRTAFHYPAGTAAVLVHLLETGDGQQPSAPAAVTVDKSASGLAVALDGTRFLFAAEPPFAVSCPGAVMR
jgi:hypothetical protein